MPTLTELLDDLVAANHILAGLNVLDGFGHVSVRHPDHADRFLLSRSLAPERVQRGDLMTFDLQSNALDGDTRTPYLERFIHGALYAQRPEVRAVVHSHAPSVVGFAASSVALRPVYHMSGFLHRGAPVFEMRERFGMTDMLIRSDAQGRALGEVLGTGAVVLMRGHGYCAVGESLPEVVFRAFYTATNAAVQQNAIGLGGSVAYLDGAEAEKSEVTMRGVIGRPWELWKARFYRPE